MQLYFRDLLFKDLESFAKLTHPSMLHNQFNGPYYHQDTEKEHINKIKKIRKKLKKGVKVFENRRLIVDMDNEEIIGDVGWYWKSQETDWLEVGIVIYNEKYWGKGLGTFALKKWITDIFQLKPEIVRIGLTTWSGNERMMRLAEKIGLKLEARYINARKLNGEYYDSVSYGILREDWDELQK